MLKTIKINIAIQARKNSESIPEKSLLRINSDDLTVIDSLLQNCLFCASHIKKKTSFYQIIPSIFLLVPERELDFWKTFLRGYKREVNIIGGDETNVFSRYLKMFQMETPDYVVRLTGDCPNVPALAINKLIFTAVHHEIDYLSNCWPDYRTTIDGHDCEIISSRLFWEISKDRESLTDYDKLHVTSLIHRSKPEGFTYGMLWTKEDMSDIKTCIDTDEEYKVAYRRFDNSAKKKHSAINHGIRIFEY